MEGWYLIVFKGAWRKREGEERKEGKGESVLERGGGEGEIQGER